MRRLLAAARLVARDLAIVAPLVESTGLSREGVVLALARYLELDPSDEDLASLVTRAVPSSRVHVILSANVFTAALRALAVAWASSEHVTVRPSRRDPVFTRALVRALDDDRLVVEESMDVADVEEGEIHVYGRDDTMDSVRRAARPAVVVRGHGAGMGVAFVGRADERDGAVRAIADDVVVFDQRGCLSPRVVIVEGGSPRALDIAESLSARLSTLERAVPRGTLSDDERRASGRYVETMSFAGQVLRGSAHAVAVGDAATPVVVPPTGRHVHVLAVRQPDEARRWLAPVARSIVAVGCNDEASGRSVAGGAEHVRLSRLGWMQRPPLDGPVDLR